MSIKDLTIEDGVLKSCRQEAEGKVIVPGNVKEIADNAFSGCEKVTHVFVSSSVQNVGSNVFQGCKSLQGLSIPESLKNHIFMAEVRQNDALSIETRPFVVNKSNLMVYAFGLYRCDKDAKGDVVFPSEIIKVPKKAFAGCKYLQEAIIPHQVDVIKDSAFENCTGLQSITFLPNPKKANEKPSNFFSKMHDFRFPERLIVINKNAFKGCVSLQEVILPMSVESLEENAFEGCTGLKEIQLSSSLCIISENTFKDCTSLQEITIPSSVKDISVNAFEGCTNLKTVSLPKHLEGCKAFANIPNVIVRNE